MKKVFTILCLFILYACSDKDPVSSTDTKSGGSIYCQFYLFDQYEKQLSNHSGVIGQIYNEDKWIQTAISDSTGKLIFRNIPAGVFKLKYIKPGFITQHGIPDTIVLDNVQFVGSGQYNQGGGYFYLDAPIDTTLWEMPVLNYKIEKEFKTVKIWIKDTTYYDSSKNDYGNLIFIPRNAHVFGNGTQETWKVNFHLEFAHARPVKQNTILEARYSNQNTNVGSYVGSFQIPSIPNTQMSVDWVYKSPNIFVKDSLGNLITKYSYGGAYSDIKLDYIDVQASTNVGFLSSQESKKYKDILSPKINVKLRY